MHFQLNFFTKPCASLCRRAVSCEIIRTAQLLAINSIKQRTNQPIMTATGSACYVQQLHHQVCLLQQQYLCRLSLPSRALENNLSMGINYLCTLIQTYAHSGARYVPVLIPRRTKEPKRRHIGAPQFADVSLLKVAIGRAVPYRNGGGGGQLALSTFQSP